MRQGTEFQVDLSLLTENFKLMRTFAPKNQVIFMVKSNAYGHGIVEVSEYVYKNLDINRLGVASLGEALYLREKLPELHKSIWVFSDTEITNEEINEKYLDPKVVPVISSLSQLEYVLNSKLKSIQLVIKFDTGMNRLGIAYKEYEQVLELLKNQSINKIKHLMTHFASSFIKLKEGDRTHQQYNKFLKLKEKFKEAGIEVEETSCANSGAIEQKFALEESHIRPGLMLYGPRSVGSFKKEEALWEGKSISCLKSKIIKALDIKKGQPIGYGGHVCHADGIIAYLPIGYGDGILTYYSGAQIKYKSMQGKIIGRVNMDLIAVFFEDELLQEFNEGDEVNIWTHNQDDVVEFANQVKSIPYQVYTAITDRVPKRFKYQ